MAEVKISALPSGSHLDGTELVPVVQDGETIQVTTQEIADLSGASFNPESIATNLLYSTTTDPRKLERTRTGGGAAYTEKIELSDGATTVENRKVDSDTRYAQLILEALVGATLYYSSPEGNNRLELLPNVTKILQVARYFSTPTIANDLDIVYKKWVEDGFTLTGALNFAPSVALPSSTNPALGATYSNNVTITGNTTIAGFDNVAEGITRVVKFTGILQLTYNATSLILPSNANITTAVGDIAVFRSLGSGNWECIEYTRRDGTALVEGSSLSQASQAQVEAAFDNTDQTTPVVLEQTSVLTPFNAWWLVQKVKAFFSTTANQTDSTNKRFVTDAEKVVIGNTSNTNSGNETAATIGALLTTDSTPLDSDLVVSWDGTLLMKTTWTNVKTFLKTYFDTIYSNKINNSQNTAVLFWENGIGEDLAGFYYDRTNKILTLKGTLPTVRLMNADGTYSTFERSATTNTFKLKNQVLQAGGVGKAISLNGTGQYLTGNSTGFPTGGNAFSVSTWFKTSSVANRDFINWGTYTSNYFAIVINNGMIGVSVSGGSVTYEPISYNNGAWHHLVVTYASGSFNIYIDNVLRLTAAIVANVSLSSGVLNIGVGTTFGGTTYFNGQIDQILIYSASLTNTQVGTIYNSGSGTYLVPSTNLIRRWEFEENTGSTATDLVGSYVLTLFNSVTWVTGLVPSAGSLQEATVLESVDGESNGERGVNKIGEFNGRTVLQGIFLRFLLGTFYPLWYDLTGLLYLDNSNDGTFVPTAKVNVGASTALLAGFRFIAGVLNTSSINLGDFVHNLAQRSYFKRLGATTANSVWVGDVNTLFTQTNQVTIANTVTATTSLGTIVTGQTKTIPADFFVVGKMLRVVQSGVISCTSTDTITIDTLFGATNISTGVSAAPGVPITNGAYFIELIIKCESVGASGTFSVTGIMKVIGAGTYVDTVLTKVGTTTINTTTSQIFDLKKTWSAASASNTITSYNSQAIIIN